ncbi:MAG: MMPL family transporter [Pseudomonadales bacterium]|nr:MMPL family transporter [Pseudomonadales bacterium]
MIRNIKVISLAVFFLLTCLMIPLTMSVKITPDAGSALVPRNDENAARYKKYLSHFPNDFIAIIHLSGLTCSAPGWSLIQEIESTAKSLDIVYKTVSVASAKYVSNIDDELDVRDFSELDFATPQSRCDAAAKYTPFQNILITPQSKNIAIYIVAQKGYLNAIAFTQALTEVLEPFRIRISDLGGEYRLAGEPVVSAELSEETSQGTTALILACLTMFAIVWLITRSLAVAIVAIACGCFSLLTTFAVMGLLNIELSPVTLIVGNLLFPLAAAFTIHAHGYISRSQHFINNLVPASAIKPFLFATLTTMIGFGTTAFSNSPDVQRMGFLGVVGIAACCVAVFLLVFPMLTHLQSSRTHLPPERFHSTNFKLAAVLLLGFISITLVGTIQLTINYSPNDYLKHSNKVRQDYEAVAKDFGRYTIPMLVVMDEADAALDPEPWLTTHRFISRLNEKFPDTQASWLYSQLSEMTEAFLYGAPPLDEDQPRQTFPENREQIAQFLLWYDESDLESFIDENRQQFTVLFQTPLEGSIEFIEFEEEVQSFAKESGMQVNLIGRVANNFRIGHQVGIDNLYGVAIGLTLIFMVFLVMLKSPLLAVIGVIVNGLPVMACLGTLALLNIPLDLGSSIVASICLGIAVDDTSHYLMRYQAIRTEKNCSPAIAAGLTSGELSRPIITTTLAIVVGFLWMNLADLVPLQSFSRILSIALLVGLATDLWVLPALLARFDRRLQ